MKDIRVESASMGVHSSSKMSDFFRNGSAEERRAVYSSAASTAISEQMSVVRSSTLALHHLHALGPEGSRPFFTSPRHEIVLSKNVALAFDRKSLLMIQKDQGDEIQPPRS